MGGKRQKSGEMRAGSRVLVQIIALIVVVFIAFGLASFLFFRNAQNRLIQKSKDKLVENEVELISSTNGYMVDLMIQIQLLSTPGAAPESINNDLRTGIESGTVTPSQHIVNDMLQSMIKNGLFNNKLAFFTTTPVSGGDPVIVMSSDDKYMYEQLPPDLVRLAETGEGKNTRDEGRFNSENSYLLEEDGFPEYGLENEYLVTSYQYKSESGKENLWYFSFSSMHDELAAIDTFYRNESRSVNLLLALVLGGSIIALIVMTFFVLSYLIRKKITRPIDELVTAAEQAMEGDVDVQVPVRPGEEFEGLKTAFNQMLARLREIIYQSIEGPGSTGGQPSSGTSPASTGVPVRRRGRSSMLIQVTALVVVIFIIAGGLSLFLFQKSQSRLIDRSTEKIIQSSAESITSGHYYISDLIVRYYALIVPTSTESDAMKDFLNALKTKQTSLLQEGMNLILEDLREKSLHGIELAFEALPPIPGIITVPTVFTSSDDKYMYVEVPEALVDLYEMSSDENTPLRARLNEENTYMLAEGGVPELGLEGPYLITTYKQKIDPSSQLEFWFFDFKPMQEQLADIDNFYTKENRNTIITMSIVIGVCIIVVALIIFFVLSHLLRTGITRPVDELAEAAEQVMGGNMDVVVPVRKGEEFEGLKNAFNAMVSSIRELMEKGVIE